MPPQLVSTTEDTQDGWRNQLTPHGLVKLQMAQFGERSPLGSMGAAPRLAARLVFALLLLRAFPRPGAPTAAFRDPLLLLRALTRTGLSFCLARSVDQRSSLGTSTPYPLHYLTLLFES